jgi:cell division protease FtsH
MDEAVNNPSGSQLNRNEAGSDKKPAPGLHKEPNSDQGGTPGFKKPVIRKPSRFSVWYFLFFFVALYLFNSVFQERPQTIEFSDFKQKVVAGEIQRVQLASDYYVGLTSKTQQNSAGGFLQKRDSAQTSATKVFRTIPVEDPSFIPLLDSKGVSYYTRPVSISEVLGNIFFTWILPFGLIIALWWFLSSKMRNSMGGGMGGVMSFGKNKAKLVSEGDTGVSFDDVAGADESKEELMEVVDFLQKPEKYTAIGGKIPKGVLLVGPPGTGKTMLAKAVAGEAAVPFFKMSGAEFVELFVGVGASRVRDLFQQARENSPCIIFIDELDAIGKSRAQTAMGNDEREQTLNQLLVEMDGFDSQGGVIIIGATNRPEILDPALLRPGRFDRQVLVDRPDKTGREAILKVHSREVKLDDAVDFSTIAASTAGFSGADLANLVNEAAILAVRHGRDRVLEKDFDEAMEKMVAGLEKKSRLINEKEKEIVAFHETGHALVAAFTEGSDPVQKISIVPRGMGALGYTMQLPTEDKFLINEEELLGRVDVFLGGRAAEQLTFGKISNGAANDLSRATDIVRKMITEYGMSKKFRNVYLGSNQSTYLGGEGAFTRKEYSEDTQRYIDEQIAKTIDDRYEHVLRLLRQKKDLLLQVAHHLLEVEVIDAADFQTQLKGTTAEVA